MIKKLFVGIALLLSASVASANAPSVYSGYTGTDIKNEPGVPKLGAANTVFTDPAFGSRILRVTDSNTANGLSFVPADSGFTRTFNADSTAIKLIDPHGSGYWLEFNSSNMSVGKTPHQLTGFDARWEWSATDPNILYFVKDNKIGKYNIRTGATTILGGPATGESVTYHTAVVGADAWVCAAAGSGFQDTYTKIFCVDPSNPTNAKFIDVFNKTINGVKQYDAKWPTSANGATIGIHSLYGSAGGTWLGITFHGGNWGGNNDAVLNLTTNTWSLLTNADGYWSGHVSLGNGKLVNGGGSKNTLDSRGAVVRDANDLMNKSKYQFIMQPTTTVGWIDGEHSSWFNSASNPNAPVLFSRYNITNTSAPWTGELVLAATDGSNTVWRIADTHEGGCYYGKAFAQISNDGRWALFSSPWEGTLGSSAGFDCNTRVDTFLVELKTPAATTPSPSLSLPPAPAIPSVVPVQWNSVTNAMVVDQALIKKTGCDGCFDAGASSSQQVSSNGYVEFTASDVSTLRSLGLDPGTPGTDMRNFKFSIRLQSGYAEVRESGVYKADVRFVTGDIFRIAVANGTVQYLKNGQVFYTSTISASNGLHPVACLANIGSSILNAVVK